MAGGAGKVALTSSSAVVVNTAESTGVLDFVGFGATANAYEGTAAAPAPSAANAIFRKSGGCIDYNDNGYDFTAAPAAPVNNSAAAAVCGSAPAPAISSLNPSSVAQNSAEFTLTVNGTDFADGSKVYLNGVEKTTTRVNPGRLTAVIPASDLTTAGGKAITVTSAAGTSAAATLTVTSATADPEINVKQGTTTYLTDESFGFPDIVAGGNVTRTFTIENNSNDALTIFGLDFANTEFALVGSAPTTVDANSSVDFDVKFSTFTVGDRTGSVTIRSNDQSEASYVINFTGKATPQAPTVTSLTPSGRSAGSPAFTLSVAGTNFQDGATVSFNGVYRPATFVTAFRVTTSITAAEAAAVGSYSVQVKNPDNQVSGTLPFTVSAVSPNTETFTNLPATSSYVDGSYVGDNGITWNYLNARGDQMITGKAITLRDAVGAKVESGAITGGLSALTFKYQRAFSTNINAEVFVNDTKVGTLTSTDASVKTFSLSGQQFIGDFTVSIKVKTGGQVSIDDLSWTGYTLPDLTITPENQQDIPAGAYNNIYVSTVTRVLGPVQVYGTFLADHGASLNLSCDPITGPGNFTLADDGGLVICSTAGISATGATGNIQVTGTRSFGNAYYVYENADGLAQVTGSGLPALVQSLAVFGTGGLTLSQDLTIGPTQGQLQLTRSGLNTAGHALTLKAGKLFGQEDVMYSTQVDNTGGAVTGQVTIEVPISPVQNPGLGYRHLSAPITNAKISNLITETYRPILNARIYNASPTPNSVKPYPMVFDYDQARLATSPATTLAPFSKGWVVPLSFTTPMVVGQAYSVNIPANEILSYTGTLNNGNVNIGPLARLAGEPAAGWHLLGNPYPSALDWEDVTIPEGLGGAIYVFESTGQYSGNYRTYTNGMGDNGQVAMGQGFFVRVTDATKTPTLTLQNKDRSVSFAQLKRGTPETRSYLKLEVTSTEGRADRTYVYLQQGATSGVDDRFDAFKLRNSGATPSVFTLAGTEEVSINGLPLLTAGVPTLVRLGVQLPAAGTYTLQAAELRNFAPGQTVYLLDELTGTRTELREETRYTFSTTAAYSGARFVLQLQAGAITGNASATLAAQVSLYPNPATERVTLLAPLKLAGKTTEIQVLNSLGQVVLRRQVAITSTGIQTELDVRGLAKGVYLVRLEAAGTLVTKRLVINK